MATGDVWIDTDNGQVFTYSGSAWVQQTVGALGSSLQVQRVNSGGTALEYATGAGAWSVIGTASLSGGAADVLEFTSISPTYDMYWVIAKLFSSAEINPQVQFNGDTGLNYDYAGIRNATAFSATGQTSITVANMDNYGEGLSISMLIFNTSASLRKSCIIEAYPYNDICHVGGRWINTTNLINRISIINADAGGDFTTASEAILLGRNF